MKKISLLFCLLFFSACSFQDDINEQIEKAQQTKAQFQEDFNTAKQAIQETKENLEKTHQEILQKAEDIEKAVKQIKTASDEAQKAFDAINQVTRMTDNLNTEDTPHDEIPIPDSL
ncbi:hypothetical protein COB57_00050 [Candidatus Peregrinibacteria bacterium]|nr:MAG: hypothetical protein COB57_00050 [Candidatus Peregrinibacteria bacterium]